MQQIPNRLGLWLWLGLALGVGVVGFRRFQIRRNGKEPNQTVK